MEEVDVPQGILDATQAEVDSKVRVPGVVRVRQVMGPAIPWEVEGHRQPYTDASANELPERHLATRAREPDHGGCERQARALHENGQGIDTDTDEVVASLLLARKPIKEEGRDGREHARRTIRLDLAQLEERGR